MNQFNFSLTPLLAELPLPTLEFKSAIAPTLGGIALLIFIHAVFVFTSSCRRRSAFLGWLPAALYALFLVSVAVLGASSLGAIVQFGHMSGYALLAHVAAAGGFTFLLVAVAYLYLPWNRGDYSERTSQRWWLVRWSGWALILCSIAAAVTMFLSMLPVLNTNELLRAAEIHRFSGLAVVAAALLHVYSLGCTKLGLR
jgi:hypothetical protein